MHTRAVPAVRLTLINSLILTHMKRIAYILLFLCCLSLPAAAQDLAPGQQSQGLLESRNVTVDHATGIFHYTIPLYTLKSGDYELPVSLRYTGKGVKVNDSPGLVGYNWTLDTGGVVTRTVRGGIPDEDTNYGYLRFESDTVPLSEDATRVNRHKRDGECDIFTAVFGGKSVDFIIRKGDYGSLHAEPLERTDVSIECVHSEGLINGWTVTDSDGTRYAYMRKEWTTDLNRQDDISFNGLANLKYVSSWHLTGIEPVNSRAITFAYSEKEMTRYHHDSYRIKYEYGKVVTEPDYSFSTYRNDFDRYMEEAKKGISGMNERLRLEYSLYSWQKQIEWNREPDYSRLVYEKEEVDSMDIYEEGALKFLMKDEISTEEVDSMDIYEEGALKFLMKDEISTGIEEMLAMNHRILGMTGNLSPLYTSVDVLMQQLEELAEIYKDSPDIATNFSGARNVLKQYMSGTAKKYTQVCCQNGMSSFRNVTPLLLSIRAEETIRFGYGREGGYLETVGKETGNGSTVSVHKISYSNGKPVSLCLLDRDSVPVGEMALGYYVPEGATMPDIYGFHRPYTNHPDVPFETNMDAECVRTGSLKEIRTADGGRILLDYEPNEIVPAAGERPCGGIRIRTVILEDPEEGSRDTIRYQYGQAVHTWLKMPYIRESEEYFGFTDTISYSRARTEGYAIRSQGNNGLYYSQTGEHIAGKGTRTFLFNFTHYGEDKSYAYWLNALPAYVVEQDEAGNVRRVMKYIYRTDMKEGKLPCIFPENFIRLEDAPYRKTLPQMMPNGKYMDREMLERFYGEQPGIYLDDTFINPHMEYYRSNILPRIHDRYTNISYPLHYGGATLLAERREYRPEGKEYTDFWQLMEEQQPCSRTVYHYDNLGKHTRPTRTVSYDSRGDSTVVYQVYAGDMATQASEDMAAMKEMNILSPVVKRATVKNGRLTEEEVTEYGTGAKGNGCFYMPEKVIVRGGGDGAYAPDTLSLHSGNTTDWQELENVTAAVIGEDSYLPVGITREGMHTAFLHDPESRRCILKAKGITVDRMIAIECRNYRMNVLMDSTDTMGRLLFLAEKLQEGIESYDPDSIRLDNYQDFRKTRFYGRGKRLLELLAREAEVTEVGTHLDSCRADGYIGIDEYIAWQIALGYSYFPAEGIPSPWDMTYEEMNELLVTLMEELHMNNGAILLEYLHTSSRWLKKGLAFMPKTLAALPGQHGYRFHLVPLKEDAVITYTVTHGEGTVERTVRLTGMEPGVLKVVAVDPGEYANVTEMAVTGFGALQFLALLPEGTEFEATSYNGDGTVAVSFDHSGKMLRHEYDSAGRLVRVRDENGKMLEESDYHVKNTTIQNSEDHET